MKLQEVCLPSLCLAPLQNYSLLVVDWCGAGPQGTDQGGWLQSDIRTQHLCCGRCHRQSEPDPSGPHGGNGLCQECLWVSVSTANAVHIGSPADWGAHPLPPPHPSGSCNTQLLFFALLLTVSTVGSSFAHYRCRLVC